MRGAIVGLLIAMGAGHAANVAVENAEQVERIIESAQEAYGGSEALDDLETLIVDYDQTTFATGQSKGTEPPWDENHARGTTAMNLSDGVFFASTKGQGGGFQFDTKTIIAGDSSRQVDLRAGTVAPVSEPDFATTSGPFVRVTPVLLVKQLMGRRQNAYYLGKSKAGGKEFEVVGLTMEVGPSISLYFDSQTHLLARSERILPGFGLVEYFFNDYKNTAGIPFNREFVLKVNGDNNLLRTNKRIEVNHSLERLLAVNESLVSIPAIEPDPLARQEIDDGVYLIGGSGTYALFVDMGDYVLAAGGTAGIPDRIDLLREVVGDKPVRYAMVTHHHSDHVMGIETYEEEGAIIIAASEHEAVVRSAAENGDTLRFEPVTERWSAPDSSRKVEIIDIGPTAHTNHLLVLWLPESGILFEGDHFAMPGSGSPPPAVDSTRTFAAALASNDLQPRLIVSEHSARPGTMDDLREALSREVASAAD